MSSKSRAKYGFVAAALFVCVVRLLAAISFNTGEAGNNQSESATDISISLTLSSGTSHLWCVAETGTSNLSATWNGSENFTNDATSSNSGYGCALLHLANPTSGSHSVSIHQDGIATILLGACAAYSGGTGGPETSAATGTRSDSSDISVSETTVANNAWVIGGFCGSANVDPTATTGNLRAKGHNTTTAFGQVGLLDAGPVSPAGSQAIVVGPGATSFQNLIVASFAPSGGGPTCTGGLLLRGVGGCH